MRTTRNWRPAGAIRIRLRSSRSPSVASRTRTPQIRCTDCANSAVKPSGMCWTMTTGGQRSPSAGSTCCSAWVPPAEAPMAISRPPNAAVVADSGLGSATGPPAEPAAACDKRLAGS